MTLHYETKLFTAEMSTLGGSKHSLPLRYTMNERHTAALAYVPAMVPANPHPRPGIAARAQPTPGWVMGVPAPYTHSPEVSRIHNWCCGPRHNNKCIPGARTAYPCAHSMAAMFMAGTLAWNPAEFHSTWANYHLVDCGAHTAAYNAELCRSHYC